MPENQVYALLGNKFLKGILASRSIDSSDNQKRKIVFANCQLFGMDLAFPDVCLTPMPLPVPVPYPNMAMGFMATPHTYKVLFAGMPAHNMATRIYSSMGDNAGVNLGVVSGTVMGISRHLTASFTTLIKGSPATRMTSLTLQNGTNMIGMRLIPSQFTVMMLGL
jgi:hypothetical protein